MLDYDLARQRLQDKLAQHQHRGCPSAAQRIRDLIFMVHALENAPGEALRSTLEATMRANAAALDAETA